jgi:hypothetical protein
VVDVQVLVHQNVAKPCPRPQVVPEVKRTLNGKMQITLRKVVQRVGSAELFFTRLAEGSQLAQVAVQRREPA